MYRQHILPFIMKFEVGYIVAPPTSNPHLAIRVAAQISVTLHVLVLTINNRQYVCK